MVLSHILIRVLYAGGLYATGVMITQEAFASSALQAVLFLRRHLKGQAWSDLFKPVKLFDAVFLL